MKYWIVKGNPYWNDWESMLIPNSQDVWVTHRPPKNWSVGDTLIFWDSAPRLRICALGKLNKEFIRVNTEGYTEYGVIYLTKYLKNPLTISELRNVPIVNEASFLKSGPAVSVFPITNEQGKIILDVLFERNTYLIDDLDNAIIEKFEGISAADSLAVFEGNPKLVKHIYRERNQRIIKLKKESVLRSKGKLDCEVCGFNFENNYGLLGKDFCEVHHKNAIADYDEENINTIDDLAILCPNCHRIIHKTFPLMDISDFKKMLEKRS